MEVQDDEKTSTTNGELSEDDGFEAYISQYFNATHGFPRRIITTSESSSGLDYNEEEMDEWREISRRLDDSSTEEGSEKAGTEPEVVQPSNPPASKDKAPFKVACKQCWRVFRSMHTLKCHQKQHEKQAAKKKRRSKKKKTVEYRIESKKIVTGVQYTGEPASKGVEPIRLKRIKILPSKNKSFSMKHHEEQKKFECKVCASVFGKFYHLLGHLRMKHCNSPDHLEAIKKSKEMRTCQICNKVFLKPWLHRKHIENYHKSPTRTTVAEYCRETSASNHRSTCKAASKSDAGYDSTEPGVQLINDHKPLDGSTNCEVDIARTPSAKLTVNLQKLTSDVPGFSGAFEDYVLAAQETEEIETGGHQLTARSDLVERKSESKRNQGLAPENEMNSSNDSEMEDSLSNQLIAPDESLRDQLARYDSEAHNSPTEAALHESISSAYCSNDSIVSQTEVSFNSTKSDEKIVNEHNHSESSAEKKKNTTKVLPARSTSDQDDISTEIPTFDDPFLELLTEDEKDETVVQQNVADENKELPSDVDSILIDKCETDDTLCNAPTADDPESPFEAAQHESCSSATCSNSNEAGVDTSDVELSATDSDVNCNVELSAADSDESCIEVQASSCDATDDERSDYSRILEVQRPAVLSGLYRPVAEEKEIESDERQSIDIELNHLLSEPVVQGAAGSPSLDEHPRLCSLPVPPKAISISSDYDSDDSRAR